MKTSALPIIPLIKIRHTFFSLPSTSHALHTLNKILNYAFLLFFCGDTGLLFWYLTPALSLICSLQWINSFESVLKDKNYLTPTLSNEETHMEKCETQNRPNIYWRQTLDVHKPSSEVRKSSPISYHHFQLSVGRKNNDGKKQECSDTATNLGCKFRKEECERWEGMSKTLVLTRGIIVTADISILNPNPYFNLTVVHIGPNLIINPGVHIWETRSLPQAVFNTKLKLSCHLYILCFQT